MKTHRGPWDCPSHTLGPSCPWLCGKFSLSVECPQCGGVHGHEVIHLSHFLSLVSFNSVLGGWNSKALCWPFSSHGHVLKTLSLVERWIKPLLFSIESSEGIYVFGPWSSWHLQGLVLAGMFFLLIIFIVGVHCCWKTFLNPACTWLLMEKCLPWHVLVGTTYIKTQLPDHPSSQTFINIQEGKKLCRKTISLNKILKEFPFHFS